MWDFILQLFTKHIWFLVSIQMVEVFVKKLFL